MKEDRLSRPLETLTTPVQDGRLGAESSAVLEPDPWRQGSASTASRGPWGMEQVVLEFEPLCGDHRQSLLGGLLCGRARGACVDPTEGCSPRGGASKLGPGGGQCVLPSAIPCPWGVAREVILLEIQPLGLYLTMFCSLNLNYLCVVRNDKLTI